MSEDTYLKDNIKKCVDYVMSKNDDDKRRIITGMFQYNDYLINEQLLVKALNDKEKQEWFNNDMFDTYKLEIERQKEVINGMIDNEEKYNLEIIKLKSIIKEVRDLFYEKCRIKDSDGRYSFNETDIDEFRNLLDKEEQDV